MNTLLYELQTRLTALGTLGTITIGTMPASPDIIGTLYEYGGQAPERGFGIVGVKYEKPSFQLVFRGIASDYKGPRDKCEIAWRFLTGVTPGPLGAGILTEYLQIDPQQSPFPTEPPDENKRIKIGCNFYALKVPSL